MTKLRTYSAWKCFSFWASILHIDLWASYIVSEKPSHTETGCSSSLKLQYEARDNTRALKSIFGVGSYCMELTKKGNWILAISSHSWSYMFFEINVNCRKFNSSLGFSWKELTIKQCKPQLTHVGVKLLIRKIGFGLRVSQGFQFTFFLCPISTRILRNKLTFRYNSWNNRRKWQKYIKSRFPVFPTILKLWFCGHTCPTE